MRIEKLAATAAMAGALGLTAFGLGSGTAQADPKWPGPNPPGHDDIWLPGDPPGHNPWGPPGQVKKWDTIGGLPNPFEGVPPGHWDDPAYFGLPVTWDPDGPGVIGPLPVNWYPDSAAWGVKLDTGVFVALPRF